jgi:enoyl-CoA hydratase/carnithine racemase
MAEAEAKVNDPSEAAGKLVEYRTEGGVALLTLNDPPANTYSYEMMQELDRAILAAWACQPADGELIGDGDDPGGFKSAMILDVIAVAGIRPGRCNDDMA